MLCTHEKIALGVFQMYSVGYCFGCIYSYGGSLHNVFC